MAKSAVIELGIFVPADEKTLQEMVELNVKNPEKFDVESLDLLLRPLSHLRRCAETDRVSFNEDGMSHSAIYFLEEDVSR